MTLSMTHSRRKILVVDDDVSAMLEFLRKLESGLAAEYQTATSVKQAIDCIYSGVQWDGALFDLVLPLGKMPKRFTSAEELGAFVCRHAAITLAMAFQKQFPGR